MADLTTKTLNELDTVDSVASTDHVLIESGGRMKRADSSLVGGAAYVLYTSDFKEESSDSMSGIKVCHNTAIYNGLLRAIDEGRPVTLIVSESGAVFYVASIRAFSDAVIILDGYYGFLFVTPSDGYSSSDLYTPRNITPTEQYMPTV